jgi:uncharacterized membrane protein YgdD (TMEM256/DUF423 family)
LNLRILAAIAPLYGLLAVMLAATGSHILPAGAESAQKLWATALQMHMFHTAVLLGIVALARILRSSSVAGCGLFMALGVLLFSGTLYLRAIGIEVLPGPVTPIGGATIMLSWIMLNVILIRNIEF